MEHKIEIKNGSLEKLKVAVLYGADAVYLGGQHFSLRSAADNFTEKELREAPDVGNRINASFIKGLADVNQKMVILLQLENLLEAEDLELTKDA